MCSTAVLNCLVELKLELKIVSLVRIVLMFPLQLLVVIKLLLPFLGHANSAFHGFLLQIQHNFLNSKMKRVNERAQQVHITCRKGDADDGREDSLPNCGRKQGQTFDSQRFSFDQSH